MPIKDEPVKEAIQQVIGTSRKGRRKVIKLVRRKYPQMGSSKIRRVYEQQGFSLMKKLRRRMKDNPRNPIEIPFSKNEEWAIDFMSDSLINGRAIRSLNIIDHFNRECKGIFIRHSIPSVRVIEMLEQIIATHGKPKKIRSDNGPEFISKEFKLWMHTNQISWSRIQKGKPQQNAIVERFNKTVREDFFDANIFFSIDQANELAKEFICEYNEVRPHESLNDLTPIEYAA